jgi:hypothetical protein
MQMDDAQLQASADFYGIDMDEARKRHAICLAQGDNPQDPICIGCARRPTEILSYIECAAGSEEALATVTPEEIRLYVIHEEGTYNPKNGHFLCDECYIRNGMPSREGGWVCP